MTSGVCLCGALRYEVDGPLESGVHCHCSRCRKHHGAPFATFVFAAASSLRWQTGEAAVCEYVASGSRLRRFCGVCGSVAPTALGERVLLPAGNLLGDLAEVAALHRFVGSKAPWHIIADGLPEYDGAPSEGAEGERAEGRRSAHEGNPPAPARLDGAAQGGCLCGAVTFAVSGTPARWFQCHCSRCRRGRSAAHGSNGFYPSAQFTWLTGRELVRSYKPPEAERFTISFCTRCGGGAPVERENVPFVLVPMALLDADPGSRPQAHIHVASKAVWYTLGDGLTQFAELPPP